MSGVGESNELPLGLRLEQQAGRSFLVARDSRVGSIATIEQLWLAFPPGAESVPRLELGRVRFVLAKARVLVHESGLCAAFARHRLGLRLRFHERGIDGLLVDSNAGHVLCARASRQHYSVSRGRDRLGLSFERLRDYLGAGENPRATLARLLGELSRSLFPTTGVQGAAGGVAARDALELSPIKLVLGAALGAVAGSCPISRRAAACTLG